LPHGTDSVCRTLLCAGGGAASPPPSRAGALRARRPAARAARPNLSPVAGVRNDPQPASAIQRAGVLDHQGDAQPKTWQLSCLGRNALPKPRYRIVGSLPEPAKSAYGVPSGSATPPLDRTRPTRRSCQLSAACPPGEQSAASGHRIKLCAFPGERRSMREPATTVVAFGACLKGSRGLICKGFPCLSEARWPRRLMR
jgi:hypothetical protein